MRRTRRKAEDIVILSSHEAIRHRPKMYLGRVDVPVLVQMAIADIVECDAQYSRIELSLDRRTRTIRIVDDGAGLDPSTVELRASHLATGSWAGPMPPRGLVLVIINALSEQLEIRISNPSGDYFQRFVRDKPQRPARSAGTTPIRIETCFTARRDVFGKRPLPTLEALARHLRSSLGETTHVGLAPDLIIVTRSLLSGGSDG